MDNLKIREEFYSKEDLNKLKVKLIYVAKDLVKEEAVWRRSTYYRTNQWLIVKLEGLEIEFYFDAGFDECKINGVAVNQEIVKESSIKEAYSVLIDCFR